jgi:hypothetical protein
MLFLITLLLEGETKNYMASRNAGFLGLVYGNGRKTKNYKMQISPNENIL